jgi:hypothetical protein
MQKAQCDGLRVMKLGIHPVMVGVTGHRDIPSTDVARLKEVTRSVLTDIQRETHASPHVLLTALAEGADRLAAQVALEIGWTLGAIIPAPVGIYSPDFVTAESLAEFNDLLAKSSWIDVLPAESMTPAVYRAAGIKMIKQASYLLAYWDGDTTIIEGGTADIVDAFIHGIPDKRLDATATDSALKDRKVIQIQTRRMRAFDRFSDGEVGVVITDKQ